MEAAGIEPTAQNVSALFHKGLRATIVEDFTADFTGESGVRYSQ
jgi:hypothetical protein